MSDFPHNVTDNTKLSRYERIVDGEVVFVSYRREDNRVALLHVETPVSLRGRGEADKLMQGVAAIAKAEGLSLVPICTYAAAWIQRHPEL